MIRKIVFLDEVPLDQRLYHRYGIGLLREAGFEVEIWDCVSFLAPGLVGFHCADPLQYPSVRTLLTTRQAVEAIGREPPTTVFVVDIGYRAQSWTVFRALSLGRHPYGIQLLDAQPPDGERARERAVRRIRKLIRSPRSTVYALFRRVPPRWSGIRSPDFVLSGGSLSVDSYRYPYGAPTREIRAHALDYDTYLSERGSAAPDLDLPHSGYAVFLDQFWPFHPDILYSGMPFPVTPDEYYPKLGRLFEHVERALGLPVVIAAHPKSHYERLPDYFAGRQVIRGKTGRLVRNATLVMTHDSASLNFAVLYRKPVVILRCEVHPAWKGHIQIDHWAGLFGKRAVDLEQPVLSIDWDRELTVDVAAYARYQEHCIKQSGSPDKPAWRIFAEYLDTLQ